MHVCPACCCFVRRPLACYPAPFPRDSLLLADPGGYAAFHNRRVRPALTSSNITLSVELSVASQQQCTQVGLCMPCKNGFGICCSLLRLLLPHVGLLQPNMRPSPAQWPTQCGPGGRCGPQAPPQRPQWTTAAAIAVVVVAAAAAAPAPKAARGFAAGTEVQQQASFWHLTSGCG